MILGIETSSAICSVALRNNKQLLLEYNYNAPMQHAALLGRIVPKALDEAAMVIKKATFLQAVSVALGPGSFTGLRIGLSYAQGLCYGNDIDIIGITNHHVLASQINSFFEAEIFTVIDARRGEFYFAKHLQCASLFKPIKQHTIIEENKLAETIPDSSAIICAPGVHFSKEIENKFRKKNLSIINGIYSAAIVAGLGELKLNQEGADDLDKIEPLYMRKFAGEM